MKHPKPIEWERQGACIVVTSHKPTDRGYISLMRCGKQFLLHRAVLQRKAVGIGDSCALHTCDNRRCINPSHLYVGTRANNSDDKVSRNRHLKGAQAKSAKLTDAQVIEIMGTETPLKIAANQYNVSMATISMIRNRRTWKHL